VPPAGGMELPRSLSRIYELKVFLRCSVGNSHTSISGRDLNEEG
jgi:hypothetical protein